MPRPPHSSRGCTCTTTSSWPPCATWAGPLSEFLMLGNVATRFEGELEYDPAAGSIVNHPAADRVLEYEYRNGWAL